MKVEPTVQNQKRKAAEIVGMSLMSCLRDDIQSVVRLIEPCYGAVSVVQSSFGT